MCDIFFFGGGGVSIFLGKLNRITVIMLRQFYLLWFNSKSFQCVPKLCCSEKQRMINFTLATRPLQRYIHRTTTLWTVVQITDPELLIQFATMAWQHTSTKTIKTREKPSIGQDYCAQQNHAVRDTRKPEFMLPCLHAFAATKG